VDVKTSTWDVSSGFPLLGFGLCPEGTQFESEQAKRWIKSTIDWWVHVRWEQAEHKQQAAQFF
jgi:hypothetical protein